MGKNVPDYMTKGGVTYRLISDYRGSVRLVVKASTGDIVQRLDYDAFGVVVGNTNPGFQPFGFAGGILDDDTGLSRFGARSYDPRVGRWLQRDPILFDSGTTNLYTYAKSDPINLVDNLGLACENPLEKVLDSLHRLYDWLQKNNWSRSPWGTDVVVSGEVLLGDLAGLTLTFTLILTDYGVVIICGPGVGVGLGPGKVGAGPGETAGAGPDGPYGNTSITIGPGGIGPGWIFDFFFNPATMDWFLSQSALAGRAGVGASANAVYKQTLSWPKCDCE